MNGVSYERALAVWVEEHTRDWAFPFTKVRSVVPVEAEDGGHCGNDTCWFEGNVVLSFLAWDDSEEALVPRRETFSIEPGEFISEAAKIHKRLGEAP